MKKATLCIALALTAACAGDPPPSPDLPQPAVPNLAGLDVMVLPAQPAPGGVPAGFDEALSALLETEYDNVDWRLPGELVRAAARSPILDVDPRALSVSILRNPEETHIRDPLLGDLRRLGGLVDARYAVVVYRVGYVVPAHSTIGQGRIEAAVAILDTVGGRILWRGLAAGERGPVGDEVALATAVQNVARLIGPAQ
ncbi:MAG TPA: hypothetical protein VF039_11720 [Longimicrobiales bacterium]